jgi:hypothetical protein
MEVRYRETRKHSEEMEIDVGSIRGASFRCIFARF